MVRSLLSCLLLVWPLTAGVEYSGVGQFHTCDSNADIDDMTSGLTLASWNVQHTDNRDHVSKGSVGTNRGWIFYFATNPAPPDACHGIHIEANISNMTRYADAANCLLGTLQHTAITWTGAIGNPANNIKVYINGSEASAYVHDAIGAGLYNADALAALRIASAEAGGATWDGDIHCVAIWDTVLTDEEVATVAAGACRNALKVQSANLRRLYEMVGGVDGVAAGILHNLVGDETCTVTGAPTWEPLAVGK